MVVNIYSSLRGAQLCSRAGEAEVKRETPSLPFGSDTWDVEQRDVQEALLVAEYKTGQREAEAKPRAAVCTLLRSLGRGLWAVAALEQCGGSI